MIDREPPNAAETRGASVRTRFCETSGLVRAPRSLPIALERRIVGFQKPSTGESRFRVWGHYNLIMRWCYDVLVTTSPLDY
jgi:hypothetical protein